MSLCCSWIPRIIGSRKVNMFKSWDCICRKFSFMATLFITFSLLLSVLFYFFSFPLLSAVVKWPGRAQETCSPPFVCLRHARTHTHTRADTHTSHLDLCLILRQSPDRKHLSRWNPARERKRESGSEKERKKYMEKKKNINPSVVEMHVTVVTLKATSTNRVKSKLVWKRQVIWN